MEESKALVFASNLQLPVPNVLEAVVRNGSTSILMDYIDGECLEDIWPQMSTEEKMGIAQQLRRIISAMRAVSPSQQTIGGCEGPVHDCRQFSDYSGGPFHNEADFNNFILDLIKSTPVLIRSSLAQSLRTDHRILFTHGDLTPRNLLVKDGHICGLLDWEYAGWYPEYWEYVKFFDRPTNCKDWKDFAGHIFETLYPAELISFQALARWQSP